MTNAVERGRHIHHLARRLGADPRTPTSIMAQLVSRPMSRPRRGTRSPAAGPPPPALEWDEGLPVEKPLVARPGHSLRSENVASHLVYTVLLMRRAAARRARKELDSTWADALGLNDRTAIGAYGQQVLELEALRLRIDQALGIINDPLNSNHG